MDIGIAGVGLAKTYTFRSEAPARRQSPTAEGDAPRGDDFGHGYPPESSRRRPRVTLWVVR